MGCNCKQQKDIVEIFQNNENRINKVRKNGFIEKFGIGAINIFGIILIILIFPLVIIDLLCTSVFTGKLGITFPKLIMKVITKINTKK